MVLDEAQTWPAVFPRLRTAIDRHRSRKGRFLLLGSVSPALMTQVSESLAGRMALVELTPFLVQRGPGDVSLPSVATWRVSRWRRPRWARRYPTWQRDYLALLAQRDLPAWGLPAKPQITLRLMRMLAALNAQMWNASQVGQSLGLSYHTVNSYLDFLRGRVPGPQARALRGELRRAPHQEPEGLLARSGLLHCAPRRRGRRCRSSSQPWLGASWEGFVVEQVLGLFEQRGSQVGAFYLRTSDQREIDLVLDLGSRCWAIEIKLTSSPGPGDMEKLDRHADLIKADKRILISRTGQSISNGRQVSCDLPRFAQIVREE